MFRRPVHWRDTHPSPHAARHAGTPSSVQEKKTPLDPGMELIRDFVRDLANDLRSQPSAYVVATEAEGAKGFNAGDVLTFGHVAIADIPEAGIQKRDTVVFVRRDQAPVKPGQVVVFENDLLSTDGKRMLACGRVNLAQDGRMQIEACSRGETEVAVTLSDESAIRGPVLVTIRELDGADLRPTDPHVEPHSHEEPQSGSPNCSSGGTYGSETGSRRWAWSFESLKGRVRPEYRRLLTAT